MMFYLLSLMTGILECGWIAHGVVHGLPLWQILCCPLAYHIGNLFPKPFSLSKKCLLFMAAAPSVMGAVTLVKRLPERTEFVLTCVSLFLLSAVIQSVRSGLKSDGNRLMKRIFRVGGFALAPIAAIVPSVILIVSSGLALYGLRDYKLSRGVISFGTQKGFSVVMLFHQLHYFFYAHITFAAMSLTLTHNSPLGILYAALLFCGTWVTYMSVEPIVSKLTKDVIKVFYAGHIGTGILLFAMNLVSYKPLFIVLWLVTGFGGGVVYTISARAGETGFYHKDSMTVSENVGHTLGLAAAVCVAGLCGDKSPQIMLLFGSASAILAAVSMAVISGKENFNENIFGKG